jgi:chemotaxis protein histidine kinase CheA
MVDETTDDSNNVDMDDLDAFSNILFQKEAPAAEAEEKVEAEVDENEDDALETSEDTDAEEEQNETPAEDEESEDEAEEPEEEPKPKPKAKKSAKERIDEITAEKYELKRKLDEALEKLNSRSTEEDKPQAKEPALREQLPADAPSPDTVGEDGELVYPLGEFDPKFIRDLTKFTIAEEAKAFKEQQQKEVEAARLKEAQESLAKDWNSKLDDFEKEHDDVRDSIKEMVGVFQDIDPGYGEYLAGTIMAADNGPDIMYYLSQNIGEAQKIVASGPVAATLALGRLQARLERATPAEQEKERNKSKVSRAPDPPSNRTRGQGGKFSVAPDTDDLDAFEKAFFKR